MFAEAITANDRSLNAKEHTLVVNVVMRRNVYLRDRIGGMEDIRRFKVSRMNYGSINNKQMYPINVKTEGHKPLPGNMNDKEHTCNRFNA